MSFRLYEYLIRCNVLWDHLFAELRRSPHLYRARVPPRERHRRRELGAEPRDEHAARGPRARRAPLQQSRRAARPRARRRPRAPRAPAVCVRVRRRLGARAPARPAPARARPPRARERLARAAARRSGGRPLPGAQPELAEHAGPAQPAAAREPRGAARTGTVPQCFPFSSFA